MQITLKSLKIFEPLSDDSTAFVADIYADGKRIGTAKNDGRGGPTYCRADKAEAQAAFLAAEKYCDSLPPRDISEEGDDKKVYMPSSLEAIIDDLVYDYGTQKAQERFTKKFNRDQQKYLLFTKAPQGKPVIHYTPFGWTNYTIDQLLSSEKGIEALKKGIASMTADGYRLISTNIPESVAGMVATAKA